MVEDDVQATSVAHERTFFKSVALLGLGLTCGTALGTLYNVKNGSLDSATYLLAAASVSSGIGTYCSIKVAKSLK